MIGCSPITFRWEQICPHEIVWWCWVKKRPSEEGPWQVNVPPTRRPKGHFWQSRILTRSVVLTGYQDKITVTQMGVGMKLRKIQSDYNIGLDLGTASVGWAVIDMDGNLLTQNGKPTWGSRVFPSGETAADTRLKRGQRRRYERRRWRLDLLQGLFEDEMQKVDQTFFIRLKQSRLLKDDRNENYREYHSPLFISAEAEREYYDRFPTIYHLRAWLMTTDDKADLREIYLALHNIVKHRGNFLHQDNPNLSAEAANMADSVDDLCAALEDRCAALDYSCSCDSQAIQRVLEDQSTSRAQKQEAVEKLLGLERDIQKTMGKNISKAILGYKADFALALNIELDDSKFSLSDDEKVETALSMISDDASVLFDAIRSTYSAYVLSGILNSGDGTPVSSAALDRVEGRTISFCKVREYEQYKNDLVLLKTLVKKYAPAKYEEFFRGPVFAGTHQYDSAKAKGYTKYNLSHKTAYADFAKEVKVLLDKTDAVTDPRYVDMLNRFEEERFLRRLKTSDNGSIPYQLHLEEMDAIIRNQGKHYPFLLEDIDKLESLVSFRIPYYVGPLTQKNAALDVHGNPRFAWATRKPGMENEVVYPWNWEEVIDKGHAAHAFIQRMTSDCTYLIGEDVLPRNSLLYEEFCVLNELNGARYSVDGDDWRRFDYADRMGIMEDLFRQKRSVTYKMVEDWMRMNRGWIHVHVRGGQGETKFESSLPAYRFFCKDVFKVDELPETLMPMVETIILWSTLFEDRSILKEQLERNFNDRLSSEQIKAICKKRFTGWGNLSEAFLVGLKANTDDGPRSIMDILREGNPTGGAQGKTMVLMEIIHDERLGFEDLIEKANEQKLVGAGKIEVEDLPGSPALRRTVNQAVRVVEEIAHIAGRAPANIFIETTRDEDIKKKGKRTKKRFDTIKEAVEAFKADNAALKKELQGFKAPDFDDERLVLYFMQGGKSLYSGTPLDINRLSEYEVDHIIPQSYIKDDSFENKALVLKSENQAKTNELLLAPSIRNKMAGYWKELHRCGLIGDKKLNNLMCSDIGERRIKGFIARQLVETSQIVKLVKMMLDNRMPESRVVPIKASLSHELREAKRYYKCREINDFHHAHDALLAAEIGRFLLMRHPGMYDNLIGYTHVVKNFIRTQADELKRTGRMPGSAGFVISSFLHSGFDKETGEVFKDSWDAEYECERIRKYLNCRQVYLVRMPEETSGAFWDATIYSPRGKMKLSLPLKQGLDPAKYGGYSSEKYAYFFCYYASDKKGNRLIDFVPVSVSKAANGNIDAERLGKEVASERGYNYEGVARSKVAVKQLIEVDGCRLIVTGANEVRAGEQIAFSQELTEAACRLFQEDYINGDELDGLFDSVVRGIQRCSPKLYSNLKLESRAGSFSACSDEEKKLIIKGLLALSSAKNRVADLRPIGGSKFSGVLTMNYSKEMSSKGITFVDQSITGMFERKTYIGI